MIASTCLCVVSSSIVGAGGAWAAETVTYSYDALGRLVRVVKSGSVHNGVTAEYEHDKAGNRVRVRVSGR